jgi:peptide-methionine (S)-S-oxide reductase
VNALLKGYISSMMHTIFKTEITHSHSAAIASVVFGAGCFWGVERKFWSLPGVIMTSVGYAGGDHPDPTYEIVCAGITGHAEVVKVDYDPMQISLIDLLKVFWECHDPTQGMRQGNDLGTQYRSACYCLNESDMEIVNASSKLYQEVLLGSGYGNITTEIRLEDKYFLAEEYHQQYLDKNPNGYCGIGGTNCSFPN